MSPMRLWTGMFFSCRQIARPKTSPKAQKMRPMVSRLVPVHSQEADRGKIGELQVGFATAGFARLSERGGSVKYEKCECRK